MHGTHSPCAAGCELIETTVSRQLVRLLRLCGLWLLLATAGARNVQAEDLRQIQNKLEQQFLEKTRISQLVGTTAPTDISDTTVTARVRNSFAFTPLMLLSERVVFGAGGAFSFVYFPFGAETLPTQHIFDAVVGVQGHFRARTHHSVYFSNNEWILEGIGHVFLFPRDFWGVGARRPTYVEFYDERGAGANLQLQRLIRAYFYAGLGFTYRWHNAIPERVYHFEDAKVAVGVPSLLGSASTLAGDQRSQISGAELLFRWDTRDTRFTTREGAYWQGKYRVFDPAMGSDYAFHEMTSDLRGFMTFGDHTLAGQLLAGSQWGDVPFYENLSLGGSNVLRGLAEGKYRNTQQLVVQMEYRRPLYWVFSGAVFGGLGSVFDFNRRWSLQDLQAGGGVGIKARLDQSINLNLRFDIAYYAREGFGFAFELGQAF